MALLYRCVHIWVSALERVKTFLNMETVLSSGYCLYPEDNKPNVYILLFIECQIWFEDFYTYSVVKICI